MIGKIQNSTKLKGDWPFLWLYITNYGALIADCWLHVWAHTYGANVLPSEASVTLKRWQLYRVRNLAGSCAAASLRAQRLTRVPSFPCSHQNNVTWALLQQYSSAVLGRWSAVHTQQLSSLPLRTPPCLPTIPPPRSDSATVSILEAQNTVWLCAHALVRNRAAPESPSR